MTDTLEKTEAATGQAAGGFIWYELMTTDVASAKRFYDAVVGWDIDPSVVAPGTSYHMIRRSDGGMAGGVLPLTNEMRANGARPMWIGYLNAANVDATFAAIIADGGTAMMAPWDQPGVGRLAMVTDPQGTPFYLMDPLPPDGQPGAKSTVFDPVEAERVRWNELSSNDPSSSVEFYGRHFGWVQDGDMDMGPLGKYQFLHHDGVAIGAVMRKPAEMPASMFTYYFGVRDIDRAGEAITAGGGSIVQGAMEIPGGEYSINAIDPQGAAFGLVGPRKS